MQQTFVTFTKNNRRVCYFVNVYYVLTKSLNLTNQTSAYHTVNGDLLSALLHTSKTAKMIKVILHIAPCQNVNVLLSNITFIIFAVFDVEAMQIAVNSVIN